VKVHASGGEPVRLAFRLDETAKDDEGPVPDGRLDSGRRNDLANVAERPAVGAPRRPVWT
jgi:hypothetical protein